MRAREGALTRAELLRRAAGAAAALAVLDGCGSSSRSAATTSTAPRRTAAASPAGERVRSFASRPDLKPPAITVLRNRGATAAGLLFLAPSSGPGQRGCLIADNRGEPLWFHPTPATAMNFRAALYRGKPVLTWWEGKTEHGLGEGTHVIVDDSYRAIERFPAGHGRPSDLHELLVTPDGTAIVTAWEQRTRDLRSLGGRRRWPVIGGIVQELALPSGDVLFEWRSLEHVALAESRQKIGPRFDYFHVNSVDLARDGNLIVSARNTWAVYKVSRRTGRVLWRLGGRRSDFRMGRGTAFAWQHDAREHDGGRLLSLFDNGGDPRVQPQSKAMLLALDEQRMRATLRRAVAHRPPMRAHALGSSQLFPNGNLLVGWGTEPYFTEYAPDGRPILDAKLPRGGQNYRTLRFPWIGRPSEPPRLVALGGAGGSRPLAVSWNGATEVAAWQLRTGAKAGALAPAQTVPRSGFETRLAAPAGAAWVAAVALDAGGAELGSSKPLRLAG